MTAGILVHPDPASGGRAVARRLCGLAAEAGRTRGRFALGVSGGESPEPLFRALAAVPEATSWSVFWCDERQVPPDDARSNYGLARRRWLAPAHVPAERTFPIPVDRPVEEDAAAYERTVRAYFDAPPSPAASGPAFDALVLGVGPDGHTASLFPGAPELEATGRWVVGVPRPARPPLIPRVSLTLEAIGAARAVLFLAWGEGKREILGRLFADPGRGGPDAELPAARVRARGSVEWHIDRAAVPEPGAAAPPSSTS
jgi:6-phosphogluconolactonase